MEYLDSITFSGWLKLLSTFIPVNWVILLVDLIAYVLVPVLVLLLLINIYKKRPVQQTLGAWRTCGKYWLQIGLIFLLGQVILYFVYQSVLTFKLSDVKSLQTKFREQVYAVRENKPGKEHENIAKIAAKYRNSKRPSAIKTGDTNESAQQFVSRRSKEYKVVAFFYKYFFWLHHLLYALAWIIFTCVYFWPALKMRRQKTDIKY